MIVVSKFLVALFHPLLETVSYRVPPTRPHITLRHALHEAECGLMTRGESIPAWTFLRGQPLPVPYNSSVPQYG